MRKIYLILCCLVFGVAANAETPVGGLIESSETWNTEGSPYIVESPVSLDSGVVLTIEPGVTVLFASAVEGINVFAGQLICNGTATDPIIFSSLDPQENPTYDYALTLNGADGSEISHIEISHASVGLGLANGQLQANDIVIRDCGIGISLLTFSLELNGSSISNCTTGLDGSHFSEVSISFTSFENMSYLGLGLDYTCTGNSISDCEFLNNYLGATGPLFLVRSQFTDNPGWGVNLFTGGVVRECDFSASEGSLIRVSAIQQESDIHINQCNFNISGGYAIEVAENCTKDTIDATENFWGVVDPESIDNLIIDAIDDPVLISVVDYSPISQEVPTETQSLSGIKAFYR